MKGALCCFLLSAVSLTGQSASKDQATAAAVSKLNSTLMALKDGGASGKVLRHQLVDQMMSLAEDNHYPSRRSVAAFADEFVNAVIGRDMTDAQMAKLQRSIVQVVRGSCATFRSASGLRETLTALGVHASKIHVIVKRFIVIGEEVRGPDDLPARPESR
jgi:predicted alpha/beta hydrolase